MTAPGAKLLGVADSLLDQIERDALDETASVAAALRKCVALGGRSGSETLRDWATRELEGYYGVEDIPVYRVVPAAIQMDVVSSYGIMRGQAVAPSMLPDFAQEKIKEQVKLRDGAGQIEELAKREEIKLGLPMGADLARLMNAQHAGPGQHIDRLYWSVSPVAVRGSLDLIRTALVKLVAELRVATPRGQDVPSEAAANQAINFVVNGKRAKVNVNAAQVSGQGAIIAPAAASPGESESGFWTTSRRVGAALVGIATIAAAVFAGIQVF